MANIIGKRIYFLKSTGEIIFETQDRIGIARDTSIEEDFKNSKRLKEYNKEKIGYIQLAYKELEELLILHEANTYSIDPESHELIFARINSEGEIIENEKINAKEIVEVVRNVKLELKAELEKAKIERDTAITELAELILGGELGEI